MMVSACEKGSSHVEGAKGIIYYFNNQYMSGQQGYTLNQIKGYRVHIIRIDQGGRGYPGINCHDASIFANPQMVFEIC